MKNLFALSFNKVFFGVLLLLVTANILGTFTGNVLFLQTTKALFVPALVVFFLIRYKTLNLAFVLFFVFSFLGDVSLAFFESNMFIKVSSVFYFLSYLFLIGVVISKFNFFKIDRVVGVYLVVVFLINAYFLYVFYGILKAVVPDGLEVLLFGVKNISLIVLTFLAFGKYLSKDTKPAIIFLMAAMCLVFSTALNYVSLYYVYNWSFVMLERVIYAIGIYLLLNYIIESDKTTVVKSETQSSFNPDNIFA